MKPVNEKNVRNLVVEMIQAKEKYMSEAMRFRQKMLQEKERTLDLRKQKSKR
jgi:hypothetical protein